MAVGLGMTDAEWEGLKALVDNSFWMLRMIGWLAVVTRLHFLTQMVGYPPLPNDDDGFSCGAHK